MLPSSVLLRIQIRVEGTRMAAVVRRQFRVLPILFSFALAFAVRVGPCAHAAGQPWRPDAGIASSHQLSIGGATLQVDFANGPTLDLPLDAILKHIQMAASAVTTYYGRFPVTRARILVVPVPGGRGRDSRAQPGVVSAAFRDLPACASHSTPPSLTSPMTGSPPTSWYTWPSPRCPTTSIGWKRASRPTLNPLPAS